MSADVPSGPGEGMVDRDGFAARLGIKAKSLTRLVNRGSLPGPDGRLGGRWPYWLESTVARVVAERAARAERRTHRLDAAP